MVHFIAYGTIILYYGDSHCVKSVGIRSYSGPYFPVFSLGPEYLRIRTIFMQCLFW